MNLDTLLIHIRCNQYSLAKKEIERSVLHVREALLIIYEIANTIMHRQVLCQEQKREFVSLLTAYQRRTVHLIKDYRGKDTAKYYNCLHFIVKYIATEYLLEELLKLRELILLDQDQLATNDAAKHYYTGTYNLILKEVIQSSCLTHRQRIDLILLQLEMRLVTVNDFTNSIPALFCHFCKMNINAEMQHDSLTKILSLTYPSTCHDDNISYFTSILFALQYICSMAAKTEEYKIDLSVVILLLKNQNSLVTNKSCKGFIDILQILSLEDVYLFPQLYKSLKMETFHKSGIREVKFISDVYIFVITLLQTWTISANTPFHISEYSADFMNIIKLMHDHFLTYMKPCPCCSLKIDPNSIFQLYTVTIDLHKHCTNTSALMELYTPMLHIAKDLLAQLKTAKCKNFNKLWSKCSSILNSLGTAMLSNNQGGGVKFHQLLLKQIGKFGFSDNFPKGSLYFIAKLCNYYRDQKDYKSAALFAAIAIYVDTVNLDQIYQIYYHAIYKLNLSLSENQRVYSIVHIINSNIKTAREYIHIAGNKLDNNRTRELLLLELNYHLTKGQSKTCAANIIKQLPRYCDNSTISTTIQKHYAFFAHMDCDMIALLQNLLKDCKESNLSSAVLNYLIASSITNTLIQKNKIDMNNTIVPLQTTSSHFEPAPDPNDTCDIVSTYSSLSLKNHKTILNHLKCAFDDIEQCLDKLDNGADLEMAFELCSKLAHSFRLHCNFTYSESAWILAKVIAMKLKDNCKILEVIGWLLHKAELNDTTKRMLAIGNKIVKDLYAVPNTLGVCWYHLHICNFYLRNCQWESAKEEYQTTKNCLQTKDITLDDKTGFDIHFAFLESMISRMPCTVAIDKKPHKPELLPKKALKLLISFLNTIGYAIVDTYHLTTYFEESDDMLMRLSLMRLPREIRLYGKDVVMLAQKLVLSVRTARILTHLAKADILSCTLNDCQMKLDGIADILNLPVLKHKTSDVIVKDSQKDEDIAASDSKLVDQFRKMELHVPEQSSMSGSPTFKKRLFKLPFFISHLITCNCFECTTPEYAILILGKLHMDFLLSESQKDSVMSEVIYEMALEVYRFLTTREKTFKQISTRNYKNLYNETYAYFLLDLVLKFGILQSNLNKALENNQLIFDLLKENNGYESDLLLSEAKIQRSLLLMHERSLKTLQIQDNLNEEPEKLLDVYHSNINDKTPERNLFSKTTENKLLLSELVIERRKKNIPFHLSDDEEENQMKPPSKQTENKSPGPKFKVLDDTEKAKFNQKSRRGTKATKVDLNLAFHCPSTSSSRVKEHTAKKTKALTEKLAKTAKKRLDSVSSDSSGKDVLPKTSRIIRKNLLQDLKDCEQTPKLSKGKNKEDTDTNNIRRCTRKK